MACNPLQVMPDSATTAAFAPSDRASFLAKVRSASVFVASVTGSPRPTVENGRWVGETHTAGGGPLVGDPSTFVTRQAARFIARQKSRRKDPDTSTSACAYSRDAVAREVRSPKSRQQFGGSFAADTARTFNGRPRSVDRSGPCLSTLGVEVEVWSLHRQNQRQRQRQSNPTSTKREKKSGRGIAKRNQLL